MLFSKFSYFGCASQMKTNEFSSINAAVSWYCNPSQGSRDSQVGLRVNHQSHVSRIYGGGDNIHRPLWLLGIDIYWLGLALSRLPIVSVNNAQASAREINLITFVIHLSIRNNIIICISNTETFSNSTKNSSGVIMFSAFGMIATHARAAMLTIKTDIWNKIASGR